MKRRTLARGMACLCAIPTLWLERPLAQERFPSRPLRLIHGFAAGGNADAIARIVAQPLGGLLGQPVVVDPRPGAGGSLASDQLARAQPDGLTLGLLTGGHSVSAAFRGGKNAMATAVDAFGMLGQINTYPYSVLVRADSALRSLRELLDRAQAKPGTLACGTAGAGTTQHLVLELLGARAGVRFSHVPYRGGAAMMTDLLSGQIAFGIDSPVAGLPHIKSGRLVALAVTRSQRWRLLPQVPTVQESGVAGFDVGSWSGMAVPRGVSAERQTFLADQLRQVLQQSEVRSRLEDLGSDVLAGSPLQMRDTVASEITQWTQLIRDTRLEMTS